MPGDWPPEHGRLCTARLLPLDLGEGVIDVDLASFERFENAQPLAVASVQAARIGVRNQSRRLLLA